MQVQQKKSEYKPKYWNHVGKYEKEMENLRAKLIPDMGKADTMHGELLRCISKLYYDVFNNGFCNSDVLQYQVLFIQNFESELANVGLSSDDWSEVTNSFKHPPKRTKLYEDEAFVKALDKFIDATVKYCLTK